MDFQHYLNCLKNEKNFSPTTVRAYANDLAIFDRFMATRGKLTIAEVDRPFITAFIQSLKQSDAGRLSSDGLSDATIARRLAVVSSFMDFVRATTLPDLRNPIKEVRRKRRSNRSCKAVDEAVLDELLTGITVLRDKTLIAMYLSTGLRLTELRSLDRDSITFDLRVNAQGTQTVSGSGQVVGKGSQAQALLRRSQDPPPLRELSAKPNRRQPGTFSQRTKSENVSSGHPVHLGDMVQQARASSTFTHTSCDMCTQRASPTLVAIPCT